MKKLFRPPTYLALLQTWFHRHSKHLGKIDRNDLLVSNTRYKLKFGNNAYTVRSISGERKPNGKYIFVIPENSADSIICGVPIRTACTLDGKYGKICGHQGLYDSAPVLFAGELYFEGGKLSEISQLYRN